MDNTESQLDLDEFDCIDQLLSFDDICSGNVFRREPHPTSTQIHVEFKFTCKTLVHEYLLSPDHSSDPIYQGLAESPVLEARVRMTDQHLFLSEAPRFLANHLSHWEVSSANLDKLVLSALCKAVKAVRSMSVDKFNVVEIDIPVTVIHTHFFHEEYDQPRMIPAAESAIDESLKDVVVTEEMNCTVCLEEMNGGCVATEMPCGHVFHGECIRKWLRTSHNCPVCRLEVPTEY